MTDFAKDLLRQIGLKYSKPREAIIDLLASTKQPLSAREITNKLNFQTNTNKKGKKDNQDKKEQASTDNQIYWPSTIYRTLEFLLPTGLISRLDIPGSEQGAYIYHGLSRERHVAVCLSCQKVIPLPECPLHQSAQTLAGMGFQVTGHRVEIYGLCEDCQSNELSTSCPCCGENMPG